MKKTTRKAELAKRNMQREEAINDMPPALEEVYQEIKTKSERQIRNEIVNAHKIGWMVRDVLADERGYGECALDNLVNALGGEWTPEKLLELRQFAQSYGKETISQLMAKRTAGDNPLTLRHLLVIAGLPEGEQWLKTIVQEDLTTKELDAAMREKFTKPRRRGTTIKPPRGVLSGLLQIQTYPEAVGRRIAVWDKHVFGKILKASSDEFTDELLESLDETIKVEGDAIAHAKHIIDRAEEARERVHRVIEVREQRRNNSAEDGAAPDSPVVESVTRRPSKRKPVSKKGTSVKKSKSANARAIAAIKKKNAARPSH